MEVRDRAQGETSKPGTVVGEAHQHSKCGYAHTILEAWGEDQEGSDQEFD